MQPGNSAAAVIVLNYGRYLLHLRDNKEDFFFPGHWGQFGGGVEEGEQPMHALHRALKEVLGLEIAESWLLTRFEFDLVPMELKLIYNEFFEVSLPAATVATLDFCEGVVFKAFTRAQVMTLPLLAHMAFALGSMQKTTI